MSVSKQCKNLIERYNNESDPKQKIEIKYKLGRKIFSSYFRVIMSLNDKDWRHFLKEGFEPVVKAIGALGTNI